MVADLCLTSRVDFGSIKSGNSFLFQNVENLAGEIVKLFAIGKSYEGG